LVVSSPTLSEASPYAVFTVTGQPGQQMTLTLDSDSATVGVDTGAGLQYFDGTVWQNYTPGSRVTMPVDGSALLVRTSINNDGTFEGSESFRLTASNTNGKAFAGTATIKDDGSSALVFMEDNTRGTPDVGEANDDQPKPVASETALLDLVPVPETPLAPALAEPAPVPVATFDSAIVVITPSALPMPERAAPIAAPMGEILTSRSGFPVLVAEAATPSLAVFRGITDQFIEGNKPATFALPADAFVHTRADAVVTIVAKLANGENLPAWVQFDARSGTFKLNPPEGFNEELQIKVIARDSEGREASSIFKFSVGEGKGKASTSSRSSLSEQIRLAAKRSAPWLGQLQSSPSPVEKLTPAREQAQARQLQAHG
jgi:hypothetical protein